MINFDNVNVNVNNLLMLMKVKLNTIKIGHILQITHTKY